MPAEAANVAMLKPAYRRWSESRAQDADAWLELVADDTRLRSLADGVEGMEFTAPRISRAGIKAYLDELTAAWEMVRFDMDEFVADGDRVVVIGEVAWRHKASGKVAETPKVDVWRFRDGKAVDFFELYDTARVLACTTCDA